VFWSSRKKSYNILTSESSKVMLSQDEMEESSPSAIGSHFNGSFSMLKAINSEVCCAEVEHAEEASVSTVSNNGCVSCLGKKRFITYHRVERVDCFWVAGSTRDQITELRLCLCEVAMDVSSLVGSMVEAAVTIHVQLSLKRHVFCLIEVFMHDIGSKAIGVQYLESSGLKALVRTCEMSIRPLSSPSLTFCLICLTSWVFSSMLFGFLNFSEFFRSTSFDPSEIGALSCDDLLSTACAFADGRYGIQQPPGCLIDSSTSLAPVSVRMCEIEKSIASTIRYMTVIC
jgi:hypothetical protein